MARFTIPRIQNVLKATTARLFGRLSSGTGRGEELTASQVRTFLDVYTTSEVDGLISAIDGLTSEDIDTLAELNAILSDADVASISYVDATFVPQSTLSESIDDRVAALLVAGTNISITYNDVANTLTIAGTASGGISGSTGSTDNAILRADGTGGSTVQTSTVTISDNGAMVVTAGTATTIPICAKGAASQTGNLHEWQNSAGTVLAAVDASGRLRVPLGFSFSTAIAFGTNTNSGFWSSDGSNTLYLSFSGTAYHRWLNANYLLTGMIGFGSVTSADVAIGRNAAGVVEVNNGTAGTFRDLIVRNFRMASPTVPASASATGSAGQIAWDADYIYVCTATNTWKRVAIATW